MIPGFVTQPPSLNGDQLNPIIYNVPLAPLAGSSDSKAMANAPDTGTYRLTVAASLLAIGASCSDLTDITVSVTFQDPAAADAQTVDICVFETDSGNSDDGTLGTVALKSGVPVITFRALANTPIEISTTYAAGTDCAPGPTIQISPILESLGQ